MATLMALSSLPVPTHGCRVLPPKAVVLVKMPLVPGMLPSCRPHSLLHPKSHFPPYGPSYLAHTKAIHPIRSWALAQTGPALGPLTPHWEMCPCREREGKHASTAPMGFQGPVTLGPPSGHRDRCGQCLSPRATWERVFRGCPGNVSCRSLRTAESRWTEMVNAQSYRWLATSTDPWSRFEMSDMNTCTYGQLISHKRAKTI